MALDPAALPQLEINLEYGDTDLPGGQSGPVELYRQFTAPAPDFAGHGYLEVNVSVLPIPEDIANQWFGSPDSYWMRRRCGGRSSWAMSRSMGRRRCGPRSPIGSA